MAEPPRPYAQRKRDALARLENDVDAWVASASANGAANLAPLSYHWDGTALTFAAPRASHTARNLLRSGRARVAVGTTRDVVLLEGAAAELPRGEDVELEDAHAQATGFDPRTLRGDYVYLRFVPEWIQAWREENELPGRDLMRDGRWLDS
jgi:hypothetical protein